MNNIKTNGFLDIPLTDDHFHLVFSKEINKTVKIFKDIMDYFNLDRVTLCAITKSSHNVTDPINNLKALYCKSILNEGEKASRAFVYGSIYHFYDERDTAEGYLRQVKQLDAMGVDGYKFLDGKPQMRKNLGKKLCDSIFDPMYAYIEERGLPLKFHLGDPPVHWDREKISPYAISRGWFCDETFPTLQELRDEIDGILTKFPKLKLCLAHFYFLGHDLETAKEFMEKWENVSFDLTPGASMFTHFTERYDEWRAFFIKYAHRIYFGSDTYNKEEECYEESGDAGHRINLVRKAMEYKEPFEDAQAGIVQPFGFDLDVLNKIYYSNHVTRNGENARPVNAAVVAQSAADMLTAFEHGLMGVLPEENNEVEAENLRTIYNYYSKFQRL